MDAVQTVFDTIKKVLEIIKDFFKTLFPEKENDKAAE